MYDKTHLFMRVLFVIICLLNSIVAFSQIPISAYVDYYDFDIINMARITPERYDESYLGKYNHIKFNDSTSLKNLCDVISTLRDTIVQPHLPDTIIVGVDGVQRRIQRYPKIDVCGKIVLDYGNSNLNTFYFSNGRVWNSTHDVFFRISDELVAYVRKLFPEPKYDEY